MWLDLLPALHVLGSLAAHLGDAWSSTIDLGFFIKVARGMERAASLGLTKQSPFGLVKGPPDGKWLLINSHRRLELDEVRMHEPAQPPNIVSDIAPWDASSRPNTGMPSASSATPQPVTGILSSRRAALTDDSSPQAQAAVDGANSLARLDKLESQWLHSCLSQDSDDEEYNDGNAMQYLYYAVVGQFGSGDVYNEKKTKDLSPKNVYNEKKRKNASPESTENDVAGISEEIWLKMCQWHPHLSHLQDAKYELFITGLEAWNTVVAQKAEPVRSLSPLLFSLLLQEAAQRIKMHPSVLVRSMLWRQCHWDFPEGRQLLRQLKRVFDLYARGGALTQAGFLRLAHEVGLMNEDSRTGVRERLARSFAELMKSTAAASFAEFIHLLEYVSSYLRTDEGVLWEGPWPMLQKVVDSSESLITKRNLMLASENPLQKV